MSITEWFGKALSMKLNNGGDIFLFRKNQIKSISIGPKDIVVTMMTEEHIMPTVFDVSFNEHILSLLRCDWFAQTIQQKTVTGDIIEIQLFANPEHVVAIEKSNFGIIKIYFD